MYINPYYAPYWKESFNEDFLEHFGVKGMKWGVRRYQNPDGTLTELGRKQAKTWARYHAKKAQKYYAKSEKFAARDFKSSSEKPTLARLFAYDSQQKGNYHQQQARAFIDSIYPELKKISWRDAEKEGIYLSYLQKKNSK